MRDLTDRIFKFSNDREEWINSMYFCIRRNFGLYILKVTMECVLIKVPNNVRLWNDDEFMKSNLNVVDKLELTSIILEEL